MNTDQDSTAPAAPARFVTPEALAEIFELAAAHLRNVGFTKGYFYDQDQREAGIPASKCRACALGALLLFAPTQIWFSAAERTAQQFLCIPLDQYNDADERTADDMSATLNTIAEQLRAGELHIPPKNVRPGSLIRIGF